MRSSLSSAPDFNWFTIIGAIFRTALKADIQVRSLHITWKRSQGQSNSFSFLRLRQSHEIRALYDFKTIASVVGATWVFSILLCPSLYGTRVTKGLFLTFISKYQINKKYHYSYATAESKFCCYFFSQKMIHWKLKCFKRNFHARIL